MASNATPRSTVCRRSRTPPRPQPRLRSRLPSPNPPDDSSNDLTGTVVWRDGSAVINTAIQFLVTRDLVLGEILVTDDYGNFVLHDLGNAGRLFAELLVGQDDPDLELGCFLATINPRCR